MKLMIEINEISYEEAHQENGTGEWGVKLGPDDTHAWQCPVLGDGGAGRGEQGDILRMLACYALADGADPFYIEDGPDELLWVSGDSYFLATISVE